MFWRFSVKISLSSTWSELENQGHPTWKNRRFSAGRCNLSLQQHTDIIPTATPHFRPRPTWLWSCRHRPTSWIADSRWRPPNRNWNNFVTIVHCDAIAMAARTISTTLDFDLTLRTLPDVGRRWSTLVGDDRLPKFKMAASKTGSGNNV